MINKVAEMTRLAEVRGCMAAFHDAGLIKCASEDAFDNFCEQVASQIGYDYDLQKIAAAADGILSGIKGAFTGAKIKAGQKAIDAANRLDAKLMMTKAEREAAKAHGAKLKRRGQIERALAYSGAGATGLAGAGGVAYGANALMNQ